MDELTENGGEYSLDFRASVACLIADHDDPSRGLRFLECRQPSQMFYGECEECNEIRTLSPRSCDLRVCPECAAARATDLVMQLKPALQKISDRMFRPHYQFRHVVLTTDHPLAGDAERLRGLCRRLRVAARELFQQLFPGDKYMGGLVGMEFGESGDRLHFHCLVVSQWINKERMTEAWGRLTDGHGKITWVAQVDDVERALPELTKYICKPLKKSEQSSSAASQIFLLHQLLKGMRRFTSFGIMYRMERAITDTLGLCPECGAVLVWLPKWQHDLKQKYLSLDLISADKSDDGNREKVPKTLDLPGFDVPGPDRNAIRL